MPQQHDLKILSTHFAAVMSGRKRAEIRSGHDRTFAVGDTLRLWEWDGKSYSGRAVHVEVTHIQSVEEIMELYTGAPIPDPTLFVLSLGTRQVVAKGTPPSK